MRNFPVRSGSVFSRVLVATTLVGLLAMLLLSWQSPRANEGSLAIGSGVANAQEPADKDTKAHANALSRAFRKASEVAMPSVVTIRSKVKAKVVKRDSRGPQLPQDNPFKGTPFEDFFGGDMEGFRNFQLPNQQPREGMGSGVIIDKGLVLTNNHVVAGADEVIVHLADGREYKGYDIKTDDQTDLAIVRIKDADDLPVAKIGNSDDLEIGDWVLAIGNPFELEQTVSAGIISGKGREIGSIRRAKFLQTDAAINPGNSGGPLVNLEGEVVGINTAIATNTGSFNGIGFAVPSNLAKWVIPQLSSKDGKVQRAYLGVAIGEISKELADQFKVERNSGVLVSEVFPNSPAAEAGLKVGDVITRFGGKNVKNPRELQELVERTTLGSKSKLDVLRDGKTINVDVASKALPKDFGSVAQDDPSSSEPADPAVVESSELGLDVTDLTAEQAEQLGYKGLSGALVAQADPDGVAFTQGIRPGMLILKVGKKEIKSAAEFDAAVKKESVKDGVLLLVRTKAGNRFVVLQQE